MTSHTHPVSEANTAAFETGHALGVQFATGKDAHTLIEAQRAVGAQRLAYTSAGDWEGAWQASGLIRALAEARA
jgi:hypothetical protein